MIWLVCGGRTYGVPTDRTPEDLARTDEERTLLFIHLDALHHIEPVTCLVHGAAPGADSLAKEWADLRGISSFGFPADWATHGKAAGPMRNQRMLDEGKPNVVIAFPGGRGTADMTRRARAAGIPVVLISKGTAE